MSTEELEERIDELENEVSELRTKNEELQERVDELEGEEVESYIPGDVLRVFNEHRTVTDLGTSIRLAEAIEPILKESGY